MGQKVESIQNGDEAKIDLKIEGDKILDLHSHPYNPIASDADMKNANGRTNAIYYRPGHAIVPFNNMSPRILKDDIPINSNEDLTKYINSVLNK